MSRNRNRHRDGWVTLEKRCSPHRWVVHWYLDETYTVAGKQRFRQASHVLGFKTKDDLPTKSAAESRWARQRDKILAQRVGLSVVPKTVAGEPTIPTFAHFVRTRFVPARQSGWKRRSRERFEYVFAKMEAEFGAAPVTGISRVDLQQYLDRLALRYSHDTVHISLTYLRAIFEQAVEEDVLAKNPARQLAIPIITRDRDETILSIEQVRILEEHLAGRDRIIWLLLSRCGLRAGEVFGLKWEDLGPDGTLSVLRSFARGQLGDPKTRKSKGRIAIPDSLFQELSNFRSAAGDPPDKQWIFPSSRNRSGVLMPQDYHNWLNRHLGPVAGKLRIRVNHQILRRTFASLTYNTGGDLKDIQAQLRHSNVNTTANVYTKPIPLSVKNAVEALDREIRQKPSRKPGDRRKR